jgi:hypothetical protein
VITPVKLPVVAVSPPLCAVAPVNVPAPVTASVPERVLLPVTLNVPVTLALSADSDAFRPGIPI